LRIARNCSDGALDVVGIVWVDWPHVDAERRRYRLDSTQLSAAGARRGIANYDYLCNCRRDLLEQLQPFGTDSELELGKAASIAFRTRRGGNETGADRIRDIHEYDWHATARALQCRGDGCAGGQYDIGVVRHNLCCVLAKQLVVGGTRSILALRPSVQPSF